MNWLIIILFMVTDAESKTATESSVVEVKNDAVKQDHLNLPQPDKELLLFLAEWDETIDGQWIEPSTFAEDSALSQQMDQQNHNETKKTHENNPDHL
jgi:hypothetical protein